jgi:predicted amino acid-binding ACT domain protein
MKKFVQENFTIIVLVIALLGFLKSCGDTREISKVRKEMTEQEKRFEVKIQIEGLKSEKRAIQASDRKILDVQRQTQIDEEVKKLEQTIK